MKNSYYFRKAGYLKENADNFTSFRNILLLTYYLFAILCIIIIIFVNKQPQMYIKIIFIVLILSYPFYIFELELLLYKVYVYIYKLIVAEPHVNSKI